MSSAPAEKRMKPSGTASPPQRPRRSAVERTPPKLVAFLNEKLRAAMSAPDQMKRFQDRGLDVITNTPEEYAAYLRNELQKWGKLIKERNIKAE